MSPEDEKLQFVIEHHEYHPKGIGHTELTNTDETPAKDMIIDVIPTESSLTDKFDNE